MAAYCDLWTSFQQGLASYSSLNSGPASLLDSWGDAYCGKPRTSHEICIDGSYIDLTLEKMYPPESPIVKSGLFAEVRRQLAEKGLLGRAGAYFRNSCEWMRRIRKFTFEKVRASARTSGYDFLGDINTHWHTFGYSVGMMDEFYRLKPGESVENVRRYNSAAVLLCDLGSSFNVVAGRPKRISLSVSNYAEACPDAQLEAQLVEADGGRVVWRDCRKCGRIPNGEITSLAAFDVAIPPSGTAVKYSLRARVSGLARNEWELYAFPTVSDCAGTPTGVRVVTDIAESELLAAMERGERVLLLGKGPFRSLPTTYRIGMAGRCAGNLATLIASHPALDGFPHEGYCGWQFRWLMEGGAAIQLEAGVPFDPIIDVASSDKFVIRQAALFEYRVGSGRLLVCSFNFRNDDPASAWLKARLTDYASSDRFQPKQTLSAQQLHGVISAPLLTGARDVNRAKNPNDPASDVRAGDLSRP